MTQGVTATGGQGQGATAVPNESGQVDLGQYTPFLTDNLSLSNLPSLPSFAVTQEQLRGESAGGGEGYIMEQTIAAEEEVVGDDQSQDNQTPALIDTISINTQRKIHEAIDALNR